MEKDNLVTMCENCGNYFSDEDLIYIQPDVGIFFPHCESADLVQLSLNEVLEELNDK